MHTYLYMHAWWAFDNMNNDGRRDSGFDLGLHDWGRTCCRRRIGGKGEGRVNQKRKKLHTDENINNHIFLAIKFVFAGGYMSKDIKLRVSFGFFPKAVEQLYCLSSGKGGPWSPAAWTLELDEAVVWKVSIHLH